MENEVLIINSEGYLDYPLYIRVIDSTHVMLSFLDKEVKDGAVYHIAQLKDESYYGQIIDFINQSKGE